MVTLNKNRFCPAVSRNIVRRLTAAILKTRGPKMIIEWGAGNSTLYYLDLMVKNKIKGTLVSMETNFLWHQEIASNIKSKYKNNIAQSKSFYKYWSNAKCKKYLSVNKKSGLFNVPHPVRMLSIGKDRARTAFLAKDKYADDLHLIDGFYTTTINKSVNFTCILRAECFKDQYGESPIKNEYIAAGIDKIEVFLKKNKKGSVIAMVDGGPRVDILHALFELGEKYRNAKLLVFLHDAARKFYHPILRKYPQGHFWAGSNCLIYGGATFVRRKYNKLSRLENKWWYGSDNPPIKAFTKKEAWVYETNA